MGTQLHYESIKQIVSDGHLSLEYLKQYEIEWGYSDDKQKSGKNRKRRKKTNRNDKESERNETI